MTRNEARFLAFGPIALAYPLAVVVEVWLGWVPLRPAIIITGLLAAIMASTLGRYWYHHDLRRGRVE